MSPQEITTFEELIEEMVAFVIGERPEGFDQRICCMLGSLLLAIPDKERADICARGVRTYMLWLDLATQIKGETDAGKN